MKETVTGIQIAQEISGVEATIVDLIFIHWQIAVMTQAQVVDKKLCETFDDPLIKSMLFLTSPLSKLETPTKHLTDSHIHKISNKIGFKSIVCKV